MARPAVSEFSPLNAETADAEQYRAHILQRDWRLLGDCITNLLKHFIIGTTRYVLGGDFLNSPPS